jgi:hypothetical protein
MENKKNYVTIVKERTMGKIKALVTELGQQEAEKYLYDLKVRLEKEKREAKNAKMSSLRILPERKS